MVLIAFVLVCELPAEPIFRYALSLPLFIGAISLLPTSASFVFHKFVLDTTEAAAQHETLSYLYAFTLGSLSIIGLLAITRLHRKKSRQD
jgi:hypothetical protein